MSKAKELFLSARQHGRWQANPTALELLKDAAAAWRTDGRYFSAAFATNDAIHAAWGDGEEVSACAAACVADCRRCVESEPLDSHEALAALVFWKVRLRDVVDGQEFASTVEKLECEFAERLLVFFRDRAEAVGYLVRGFDLATDMDGQWNTTVPERATTPFGLSMSSGPDGVVMHMPSACDIFWSRADYRAVRDLVELYPEEFREKGMLGRRLATEGFLDPTISADRFSRAADAFAADVPPAPAEPGATNGTWSGANLYLWSKYFRAQAAMAGIRDDPDKLRELLGVASVALQGTESGLVNSQVTRLRILVRGVASLCGVESADAVIVARKDLSFELDYWGERAADPAMMQFLKVTAIALDEFERDPVSALTSGSLSTAIECLNRLPDVEPGFVAAVKPVAGQNAKNIWEGPSRTFLHRTLESITDEKQLQHLFLRLAQGSLPNYAQVRHGPLEFGADVVVLGEEAGVAKLRSYQMKCGPLKKKQWPSVRDQLEETFLVALESVNIHSRVDLRVGVLVCNAHVDPYVDPVIKGWQAEQARVFGRTFEVMHLDDVVRWIVGQRLVREFRDAVAEIGIPLR